MAENRNNTTMRKALEEIDKNTDLLDIAEDLAPNLHPSHSFVACQIRKIVRSALSEPTRNCDVGTAEEQQERFREFCRRHVATGECGIGLTQAKCPCWRGPKNPDCALAWAQMPYETGGTPARSAKS